MTQTNHRPCPACNSIKANSIGPKNNFDVLVCRDCKTIFTSELPSVAEAQDYDKYYSDENLTVPDFIQSLVGEIVGSFADYRQTNRLLDIGFGAGTILKAASEDGWDAYGVEVSKPAVDQATRAGFNTFYGELSNAKFPDGHFDVITASEILEHMPRPHEDLREIVRILRPGGLFWATTPSARSLSFRLLGLEWSVLAPPEHIQLYSRRGVNIMLENAGFSDIRLETSGLNPVEIIRRLRTRKVKSQQGFDRVKTAYKLNESLTKTPTRKKIKGLLNGMLNLSRIGDSLKIRAQTR